MENEKRLLIGFSYMFNWLLQIVFFFIIFGIMFLLDRVFEFNQNIWLISMIVFIIFHVHKTGKFISKSAVEQTLNKEDKK